MNDETMVTSQVVGRSRGLVEERNQSNTTSSGRKSVSGSEAWSLNGSPDLEREINDILGH